MRLWFGLNFEARIRYQICNFFLEHSCATGYSLNATNQICGTQLSGSAGEIDLGGPDWPSASFSKNESEEACAKECNDRSGCTHYMWFDDKGCRTQTACTQTIATSVKNFICKKGILNWKHFEKCVRYMESKKREQHNKIDFRWKTKKYRGILFGKM